MDDMNWLQRMEAMKGILNSLSDATGTARCKYIAVLDELLNQLRNDCLIMEEKLKDFELNQNSGDSETMST